MMIMKSYIDQPIWTDFFGYHIRTRSSREDHDSMIQLQPGHGGGFPNPQDYYVQDVDWRAQLPCSNCEGEFPDSQDSDL